MDEVIDDLIGFESGFNDGSLEGMEPSIIMQNNVSMIYVHSFSVWISDLASENLI